MKTPESSPELVNTVTGELDAPIDALTAHEIRACDAEISRLDLNIDMLKNDLAELKKDREKMVERMRELVRPCQEPGLPFYADGTRETSAEYAARRLKELGLEAIKPVQE